MGIKFVNGDATDLKGKGPNLKILLQINNNCGCWGAGFVLAVSKRWPFTQGKYIQWCSKHPKLPEGCYDMLGYVQALKVEDDVVLCNMAAQDRFPSKDNPVAVSYDALDVCLKKIAKWYPNAEIHTPRIGAGLGGGSWKIIQAIIEDAFPNQEVTVYDYTPSSSGQEV